MNNICREKGCINAFKKVLQQKSNLSCFKGEEFYSFSVEKQENPDASSSNCTCRIYLFTYFTEMLTIAQKWDTLNDKWSVGVVVSLG